MKKGEIIKGYDSGEIRDVVIPQAEFLENYNDALQELIAEATESRYFYNSDQSDVHSLSTISDLIQFYYNGFYPKFAQYQTSQKALFSIGQGLGNAQIDVDSIDNNGKVILKHGYAQVDVVKDFHNAPVQSLPYKSLIHIATRRNFERFAAEIGTAKSPVIFDTLRRFIPRWMTHLIPAPAGVREEVAAQWSQYSDEDAAFLGRPEMIQQGAPIDRVFQIARDIDTPDRYKLQKHAVQTLLEMENERVAESEMPFFHTVFAACVMQRNGAPIPKGYFDLFAEVGNFMKETFLAIQNPQNPMYDEAQEFLSQLQTHYHDMSYSLVAESMTNLANRGDLDDLSALKTFLTLNPGKEERVALAFDAISRRRIYSISEVDALAGQVTVPEMTANANLPFTSKLVELLDGEDAISIDHAVQKYGIAILGEKCRLELQHITGMNTITGNLMFESDGYTRIIPYSYDTQTGQVYVSTLDGGIDPHSAASRTLARLVECAVELEYQEVLNGREEQRQKDELRQRSYDNTPHSQRKGRKHMYQNQAPAPKELETTDAEVEEGYSIVLNDLDEDALAAYVRDPRIGASIIAHMERYVQQALAKGGIFGKNIILAPGVSIRQFSLRVNGVAHRIYFESLGHGEFKFRGASQKTAQGAFLAKLTTQLSREQSISKARDNKNRGGGIPFVDKQSPKQKRKKK